jgi:hypothetical protein
MIFDPNGLPSMNEIWGWHDNLRQMGTRYTGSPGHMRFIDWLKYEFEAIQGGFGKPLVERIVFQQWLANKWSLSMQQNPNAPVQPMPVSYFYPYSGYTGPNGITARLVDLGDYTGGWHSPQFWGAAKGAIALVRVPPSTFSLDIAQLPTDALELTQASLETVIEYELQSSVVTNPVFQGMFAPVPLLEARDAGVLGAICVWTGMSDDLVANQYNPITTGYPNKSGLPEKNDPGCPALWVGEATGRQLADAAKAGPSTVTLTLDATITENAVTETIWGVLPGADPKAEGLILNTHTDGPSVPEENGALGLLALAKYFAGRQHRRNLYFVMVTGHFALSQFLQPVPDGRFVAGNDATSLWMAQNPDIYRNALAGLTLEHLGCTTWADDDNGKYGATGTLEWSTTYTTQREGSLSLGNLEQQAYIAAVAATNSSGATVHPVITMLPAPLFFGEGAPLYAGGLGTVSLCPVPSYLLQAGSRADPYQLNMDKLDPRLIYGQIQSFARTIITLDEADATGF